MKRKAKAAQTRKRGPYRITQENGNVAFAKAIRRITNRTTEMKALPLFKEFLRWDYNDIHRGIFAHTPESVEAIVTKSMTKFRENGLPLNVVGQMQDRYKKHLHEKLSQKSLGQALARKSGIEGMKSGSEPRKVKRKKRG